MDTFFYKTLWNQSSANTEIYPALPSLFKGVQQIVIQNYH